MCGIAGIYNYKKEEAVDERTLLEMRNAMVHRGPNAAGSWVSVDKSIGLAHQRLSIIDLNPRANQPMSDSEKKTWLVFNGEIYNFKEIKKELKNEDDFKTTSDAEVIIYAYKKWGVDCIHKFRGMFAFGLWDERIKTLWLVRDRIGIKPLYYADIDGQLTFASEINALFKNNNLKKEISPEGIYHYLTFLTVPAPNTMFRNIYKLEAGNWLKIDSNGNIQKQCYWNPATFLNNPSYNIDEEAALQNTERLLKESVSLRMISDVPLGATFSGGVDSSLILSLMREKKNDLSAITVDYETISPYSESSIAEKVAKLLNIKLETHKITKEKLLLAITDFTKIQSDYPAGDPNNILLYFISNLARKTGIIVTLVGEGGDEIGGYPAYLTINKEVKLLRYFFLLPPWLREIIYHFSPEIIKKGLDTNINGCIVSRRFIHAFTEREKKEMWLSFETESSYSVLKRIMDEVEVNTKDKFLRKVLNIEFKLRLPELILARVDYPTMANSVEARVPFLDHKLVEFSLRLPSKMKMKNNEAKYLLKKILCNYIDEDLIYRKKIGFGMLLQPFLRDTLPLWFKKEFLDKNRHPLFAFLKKDYLVKLYNLHQKKKNQGFKMWTVYSLGKWLEIHEQ